MNVVLMVMWKWLVMIVLCSDLDSLKLLSGRIVWWCGLI